MEKNYNKKSTQNALEKEEKVLLILRKSRKAYSIEYCCAGLLFIMLLAALLRGIPLPSFIIYLILFIDAIAVGYAEISRLFLRYIITTEKICIVRGFMKQTKKNINYHPLAFVPDISMKQNRIQRILNYGTVFVESGASSFEIYEVDNPKKVMELLEQLIEQTRAM